MEAGNYRGHAVCIPCPFQSHIKGMHKLAKLLHHKGFYITFVNTEFNHRRYLKSRSSSSSSSGHNLPNFQFETIPDGLPVPSNENANQDANSLFESISNKVMLHPFTDLLKKLNNGTSNSNTAGISSIISDGLMPFTITAAQELGIPIAFFYTIAACSLKQVVQLREENLDPVIKDSNNPIIRVAMEAANNVTKASAILIHTFDALEGPVLGALSARFPNLFTIGPLQLLLNQIEEEQEACGSTLNSNGYSLWKEEAECMRWLDSKELPNSVIYVNFGSSIFLTKQQLIEVAMGLVNSNHPFLWIIRPDLVTGDTADLPYEFQVKAKKRGFITSWCPQEEVLNHKSVGGYFTHSGWNSTIESLSAGVPMICWPFKGDQPTNCRYTCNEWGVGMEIINGEDSQVNRHEVEKVVREFMEGEKGKRMRNKAMEWKRLADEAAAPDGSSSTSLEKLVEDVLLSKEHMHAWHANDFSRN